MKTNFIKSIFSIITILFLLLNAETSLSQYIQPIGNNGSVGYIKVTSSNGSVGGSDPYYGSVNYGYDGIYQQANAGVITSAFNNLYRNSHFKATAGKPVTITIEIGLNSPGAPYIFEVSNYLSLACGMGNHELPYPYEFDNLTIPYTKFVNDPRSFTYQRTFTFPNARTEAWLVFDIPLNINNGIQHYGMVLPFIVDGVKEPNVPMQLDGNGQPRIITQPSLPVSIIHSPPGDQSYSHFETDRTTCQSVENRITQEQSNSGNGSIKLGYAGSVGFVVQIQIEAYVELTASGTEGNTNVKISNNETCMSTTTGFGTSPGTGEDLFICEGMDFNYGIYDLLYINPDGSTGISKGLAMVPIPSSKRLNLFTKSSIEDQIVTLAADTLNMALPLKQRIEFKNQLNVWKQLIAINDANIANASVVNPAFPNSLGIADGAIFDNKTSISTSQTQTIVVDNYVEANVGLQAVVNIGGSGFSLGYNMRTSKSYGQTNSATSSNNTTMTMHIQDDDTDGAGDLLNVKIYRDPMFGTPLFKLQPGSKTSCPYEGGIQRDQPVLQHALAAVDTLVVPNATLNTTVSFPLRICNNSAEVRDYKLRLSNNNGALINVPEGLLFQMFSAVPMKVGSVMGCRTLNYPVTVSMPAFNSPIVSFANLKFDLMDACESGVVSSVWATVNFGDQVKSAINGGSWIDPNTWDALRVPQPTDNVTINSSHVINGAGISELKCKTLRLNSGANLTLPANLKLSVGL